MSSNGTRQSAFREWHSLLNAGGKMPIIDDDFVSETLVKRLIRAFERLTGRTSPAHAPDSMRETHERILRQVYFSKGARAGEVVELLRQAGFTDATVDRDLKRIHRKQAGHMPLLTGLERATQHRYAIARRSGEDAAAPHPDAAACAKGLKGPQISLPTRSGSPIASRAMSSLGEKRMP